MSIASIEKEYLELLENGNIPADERLSISKGILADGTPTPPRVLARLFLDNTIAVREEAKKSILRLQENELLKIASDDTTHSSLLLLLAKNFNNSPAVGISIISNKNTTEKILFYLQGRGDEVDDDSDKEFIRRGGGAQVESQDDIELSEEVEIEIGEEIELEISESEGIGLETPSEGDIPSAGTPDLTAKPEAGQNEEVFEFIPERYTDGDMEVIIELEETDDFDEEEEIVISDEGSVATDKSVQDAPKRDEMITDEEMKSADIDIGITHHDEGDQIIEDDVPFEKKEHPDGEGSGFATAIDSIEDKVGEIFDIDLGDTDTQGDEGLGVTEGGMEFEPDLDISGMETPVEGDTSFESLGPIGGFGGGVDEQLTDTGREQNYVYTPPSEKRFVTHLATKRGSDKVLGAEMFAKVAKIVVPVVVVFSIFLALWVFWPEDEVSVEEFDNGVNRVFVKAKKKGLNQKLDNPFPNGSSIYKWEPDKVQKEKDYSPNGETYGDKKLKEDLSGFKVKYEGELEYEKISEELSKKRKDLYAVSKKIKEIDEKLSRLAVENDSYLERYKGESLKRVVVVGERDNEIGELKRLFEKEKLKIKGIESEMVAVKRRIADFERDNIPTADDHGYYANKRELDELTTEHRKLKPKFDNFSLRYNDIQKKLENKYKRKLSIINRINEISRNVSELDKEKNKTEKRKKTLRKQIGKLENSIYDLEDKNATGEMITDENLPIYLLMSKYIREQEKIQVDSGLKGNGEVSYFETYTVKQKKADIIITFENKEGKKEKNKYSTTFMRMITKKRILIFKWDVKTTEWVLTSITEKKK